MPFKWFVTREWEKPQPGVQVLRPTHYKRDAEVYQADYAQSRRDSGDTVQEREEEKGVIQIWPRGKVEPFWLHVREADEILDRPISVISSMVSEMGFDSSKGEMVVRFKNNATYRYYGVPRDTFFRVLTASSVGEMFNSLIKSKFESRRTE